MTCEFPACNRSTVGDKKMCFRHNLKYGTKAPKPQHAPIAKKSAKMKVEYKEYSKFVKEYLSRPENKLCAIQGPNCTIEATTINHLKRRFKNTKMNEEFIEPSCFTCNVSIEQHDADARATGHLLSKYN